MGMKDIGIIQLHFYKLGVLLIMPKHISYLSVILCYSTYHTLCQTLALVELVPKEGCRTVLQRRRNAGFLTGESWVLCPSPSGHRVWLWTPEQEPREKTLPTLPNPGLASSFHDTSSHF